ncbi:hypothetical protein ACLBXB_21715 [Methylobacterium mesophilicum]
MRPLHCNDVWSFDFVQAPTNDDCSFRIPTRINKRSRACLTLKMALQHNNKNVFKSLADAM